jgi:hypothetical protein
MSWLIIIKPKRDPKFQEKLMFLGVGREIKEELRVLEFEFKVLKYIFIMKFS